MKARIEIAGDITVERGLGLVSTIISANNDQNVDTIVLCISSDGGSPEVVTTISEVVKMCNKPVYALGTIRVRNVAASIFMMAEKRVLFPGTSFSISGLIKEDNRTIGFSGDKYECDKDTYKRCDCWKPIVENSNITLDMLKEKCSNNDWKLTQEDLKLLNVVTSEYNREEVKSWLMKGKE